MKNRLPSENNKANLRAFNISTGMYNVDNDIQNRPNPIHVTKPKIRCNLV